MINNRLVAVDGHEAANGVEDEQQRELLLGESERDGGTEGGTEGEKRERERERESERER